MSAVNLINWVNSSPGNRCGVENARKCSPFPCKPQVKRLHYKVIRLQRAFRLRIQQFYPNQQLPGTVPAQLQNPVPGQPGTPAQTFQQQGGFPQPQMQQQQMPAPMHQFPANQQGNNSKRQSSFTSQQKLIVSIMAGALLVTGIVVGILFFQRSNGKNENQSNETEDSNNKSDHWSDRLSEGEIEKGGIKVSEVESDLKLLHSIDFSLPKKKLSRFNVFESTNGRFVGIHHTEIAPHIIDIEKGTKLVLDDWHGAKMLDISADGKYVLIQASKDPMTSLYDLQTKKINFQLQSSNSLDLREVRFVGKNDVCFQIGRDRIVVLDCVRGNFLLVRNVDGLDDSPKELIGTSMRVNYEKLGFSPRCPLFLPLLFVDRSNRIHCI